MPKGVMYKHGGFVSGMVRTAISWGLVPTGEDPDTELPPAFDIDELPEIVKAQDEAGSLLVSLPACPLRRPTLTMTCFSGRSARIRNEAGSYSPRQASTFICPGGTAGMGWGLPAAVALKIVYPDRPVVCVTGDGGYMMPVSALSTAVQYQLPMICVVFNDNALGMVRQHQPEGRRIASEFVETDNAAVARGMGAFGVQVRDSKDLPEALRQAQNSGLPSVVDVIIDRGPSPDDWRADLRTSGET